MSTILENNVIIDMASTHKMGDSEYFHIVAKALSCENPVYVDFRCTQQKGRQFEYFWTMEILEHKNNECLKYELRACVFEQYIKVTNFNNKTKNIYFLVDKQFNSVLLEISELIKRNNVPMLDKLFKEQESLLKKENKLSSCPNIFYEIITKVQETRNALVLKNK